MDVCIVSTIKGLKSKGLTDLAYMLRLAAKEGPDPKLANSTYKMWEEQLSTNGPILYLGSQDLAAHARKKKIKKLLFVTRDCTHWYKLFHAMYPEFDVHYFHASRNMFNGARKNKNRHFDEYVASLCGRDKDGSLQVDDTMYIDVHGTGQRMVKYFEERWAGKVPWCYLLTAGSSTAKSLPKESYKLWREGRLRALCMDIAGSPIEMLNYDVIGSINDYNAKGPVRSPPEYNVALIQPYHDCMAAFTRIVRQHRDQLQLGATEDSAMVKGAAKWLVKQVSERAQKPIVARWIEHESTHKGTPALEANRAKKAKAKAKSKHTTKKHNHK